MNPADFEQEELIQMLQDTLTMVAAGRPEGHRCPVCERGDLDCVYDENSGWAKIRCPQCRLKCDAMVG